MIRQIAKETDFVSFKLDIDTPDVEIPIVQQQLSDDSLSNLIDEFFFELHFRCEFLMDEFWGRGVPETLHGWKNDRLNAMNVFLDLRKKGIRSHFWI